MLLGESTRVVSMLQPYILRALHRAIGSPQVRDCGCFQTLTILTSVQILELSGIGCREVLNQAGIEVKIDLPGVGENVQEHLWSGIICRMFYMPCVGAYMPNLKFAWYGIQSSKTGR